MGKWVNLGMAALWIGGLAGEVPALASDAIAPQDAHVRGYIFEREDLDGRPAYRFDRTVEHQKDGRRIVTMKYQEVTGEDLVVERTVYEGDAVVRYSMDQLQDDEVGWFIRDGKKFHFFKRKGDDKVEMDVKEFDGDSVVVDQLAPYLRERWERLMAGEQFDVDFIAVFRKDAIGIRISKDGDTEYEGRPAMRVKLRPRNFFISLFVRPIFLTFERDGQHKIREVNGRMPIQIIKNGSKQDLEGVMRLEY